MLSDLLSIVRTELIRGSCVENKLQSWLARNDTTVRHDRQTSTPHCLAERCHDNPGKITCTISYIHDLYVSYMIWTAYLQLTTPVIERIGALSLITVPTHSTLPCPGSIYYIYQRTTRRAHTEASNAGPTP
jgi:hypothetical protein